MWLFGRLFPALWAGWASSFLPLPLFSQGLRPLFGLGFVLLKLAIATSEASSSCNSEPHRRVIFRVAHLKFLLVLRLPAGIDLRDQVDLAPARSITIGSWFSDC